MLHRVLVIKTVINQLIVDYHIGPYSTHYNIHIDDQLEAEKALPTVSLIRHWVSTTLSVVSVITDIPRNGYVSAGALTTIHTGEIKLPAVSEFVVK